MTDKNEYVPHTHSEDEEKILVFECECVEMLFNKEEIPKILLSLKALIYGCNTNRKLKDSCACYVDGEIIEWKEVSTTVNSLIQDLEVALKED